MQDWKAGSVGKAPVVQPGNPNPTPVTLGNMEGENQLHKVVSDLYTHYDKCMDPLHPGNRHVQTHVQTNTLVINVKSLVSTHMCRQTKHPLSLHTQILNMYKPTPSLFCQQHKATIFLASTSHWNVGLSRQFKVPRGDMHTLHYAVSQKDLSICGFW